MFWVFLKPLNLFCHLDYFYFHCLINPPTKGKPQKSAKMTPICGQDDLVLFNFWKQTAVLPSKNLIFKISGQQMMANTKCCLEMLLILCDWHFLLISDVQNVWNKCSIEIPCEVNRGDCRLDNECKGHLICSRNNNKGSTLPHYANHCKEPGDEIFYIVVVRIEIVIKWWFSFLFLHVSKSQYFLQFKF